MSKQYDPNKAQWEKDIWNIHDDREAAVWLSVISEFQAEVETCLENSRNIGQWGQIDVREQCSKD